MWRCVHALLSSSPQTDSPRTRKGGRHVITRSSLSTCSSNLKHTKHSFALVLWSCPSGLLWSNAVLTLTCGSKQRTTPRSAPHQSGGDKIAGLETWVTNSPSQSRKRAHALLAVKYYFFLLLWSSSHLGRYQVNGPDDTSLSCSLKYRLAFDPPTWFQSTVTAH